jgi:hypothetical protein
MADERPAFVYEIDPYELAIRLMEVSIGLKRPEGKSAAEAFDAIKKEDPRYAAILMKQAEVAAKYIAECVKGPGTHARVQ